MARQLTRNELMMRVASEMQKLAIIIPSNPKDQAQIMQNVRDTQLKLARLARVVDSFVPTFNYGGLDYARTEWVEYQQDFYSAAQEPTP